jgi:hypothetical protein
MRHPKTNSLIAISLIAMSFGLSSCATAVHGWNHKMKVPVWVGEKSGTVYVEGKPVDVKMVVSGGDVKTKHANYYTYTTTITTQTLYYNRAVLVFPKQKFITVEVRDTDKTTVLESYLLRRDPNYLYYGLNLYLSAGLGSVVDITNNMAYDWELVAYRKYN